MSSTRLPRKVLSDVGGEPMLWRIVERVRFATLVDQVVIATSTAPADAPIRQLAAQRQIPVFAGSELDLVERLYGTARRFGATALVRITGDCPLADPDLIDEFVASYLADPDNIDYVTNEMPPTYPHGLDTELYSFGALERLNQALDDPFWREWFVPYLQNHRESFRAVNLTYPEVLTHLRWTVDYPEDLEFIRAVYQELYQPGQVFKMKEVLALLESNPGLLAINAKYATARNEAYQTELQSRGLEDKGFMNIG